MPSIAALSAAALLASLSAPPATPPDAPGQVSFSAGSSRWSGETGRYVLEGGVSLRRGAVVLRARSASFDPLTSEVVAQGDVLLLDDRRALRAETIHAVLSGPFEAEQVVAVLKDGQTDLTGVDSFAAARAHGTNRASVAGDRVEGDADGRLRLSGARVTLCDCGADRAPSWELRARKADVLPGKRATFSWPVLYVTPRLLGAQRPVPILALPWLYLPLGVRQSGLLFPEVGRSSTTGYFYSQPVFLVLGRSADATLTPEYFFGPGNPHRDQGAVAGPGARLELRWTPAPRDEGELHLRWVHDLDRDPNGAWGDRLAVEGHHAQSLGPDTRLRVRLALEGDSTLVRDLSSGEAGYFPGNAYYAKSAALLSRRTGPVVLEASAAYLEPLLPTVARAALPAGFAFGPFGSRVPAVERWPSASATLVPVRLGPLLLQGRLGASRLAPVDGARGELSPNDPGANSGLSPETVVASGRQAVTRGEARAELSLPAELGGVSVEPFVRGAALGYAFDASGAPATAAWGLGGLSARTELSRRLGGALHRVVPEVELLAGTGVARGRGGDPYPSYDVWDRPTPGPGAAAPAQRLSAAPPGGYLQLRAGVENTLEAGPAGRLQLRLDQDVDLRRGKLAESTLALSGVRGPLGAGAQLSLLAFGGRPPRDPRAEYRSGLDAFTRLEAYATARDLRGDALTAGVSSVGPGAVGAQAAGVDALFDLRPGTQSAAATLNLSGKTRLDAANISYVAALAARRTDLPCGGGTISHRDVGGMEKQTAEVVWDSPCHCFAAGVKVTYDACGTFGYGLQLDLSRLMQGARAR